MKQWFRVREGMSKVAFDRVNEKIQAGIGDFKLQDALVDCRNRYLRKGFFTPKELECTTVLLCEAGDKLL